MSPRPSDDSHIDPSAHIAPGVRLGRGVTVGPGAVVLSSDSPDSATVIEDQASIGGNATVSSGVTVEFGAQVRPGAVVTRSVPARAIAEGNPATIVGYVDAQRPSSEAMAGEAVAEPRAQTRVRDVSLVQLRTASDIRGALAVAESGKDIPFEPKRWFLVYGVPSAETRGQHAHLRCHQFLMAVSGSLRIMADDGTEREEFLLDSPDHGLYLPAMTWGVQYGYSKETVLLVVASEPYDSSDYVRDYGEFLRLAVGAG